MFCLKVIFDTYKLFVLHLELEDFLFVQSVAGDVNNCWLVLEGVLDLVKSAHYLRCIDFQLVALNLVYNLHVLVKGIQFIFLSDWSFVIMYKWVSVDECNVNFRRRLFNKRPDNFGTPWIIEEDLHVVGGD